MHARRTLATFAILLPLACSKPEPPRITPRSVTVTSLSNVGIDLDTKLSAENPNGFDLSAKSVTAKLVLDGTVDVGTVRVDKPFTLPSKGTTELDVPMSLPWNSLPALVPLTQKASVPYAVDGTVEIGGRLSIDVPFHLEGTLTRDQLIKIIAVRLPF